MITFQLGFTSQCLSELLNGEGSAGKQPCSNFFFQASSKVVKLQAVLFRGVLDGSLMKVSTCKINLSPFAGILHGQQGEVLWPGSIAR